MLIKSILLVLAATPGEHVVLSRIHATAAACTVALLVHEDPWLMSLPREQKGYSLHSVHLALLHCWSQVHRHLSIQ